MNINIQDSSEEIFVYRPLTPNSEEYLKLSSEWGHSHWDNSQRPM
jgi:hypothetical protein